MKQAWVDSQFEYLKQSLGKDGAPCKNCFFEPTNDIYKYLATGDNDDLQWVVACIAKYLSLQAVPSVKYEWGIKMEPQVAGQMRFDGKACHIRIPFAYLGNKYAVGAILAHELMHVSLAEHGLFLESVEENELLTDLAAFCAGLGKLMLNGIFSSDKNTTRTKYVLGYLSPGLQLYSYKKASLWFGLPEEAAQANLLDSVMAIINHRHI